MGLRLQWAQSRKAQRELLRSQNVSAGRAATSALIRNWNGVTYLVSYRLSGAPNAVTVRSSSRGFTLAQQRHQRLTSHQQPRDTLSQGALLMLQLNSRTTLLEIHCMALGAGGEAKQTTYFPMANDQS